MTQGQAAVIDGLVKLTILLGGVYFVSILLKRAAAAVRHRLWIGALAAVLLGPFAAELFHVPLPILPAAPSSAAELARPFGTTSAAAESNAMAPPVDVAPVNAAGISWGQVALAVWVAVALALLARLLWSAIVVRQLLTGATQLKDREWMNRLYDTADRLGIDNAPILYLSDRTQVPLACRLRRPAIVLPVAATEWSEERRCVVLLHELAHVKRRDLVGHTLGRVLCAVYWFHPLVWLAAQRLRGESERACDDLVLVGGAKPANYAHELLAMVAELRSNAAPATAMAMAANREFEGRIVAILDPGVSRQARGRLQPTLLTAAALTFGLVIAVSQPVARAATTLVEQESMSVVSAEVPRDTASLRRVLETDPSAEVRKVVAWSLHERRDALNLLVGALRSDRDVSVREMAAWALGQLGDTAVLPALYSRLQTETAPAARATIAWAIGQLRGRSVAALLPLLGEPDAHTVSMAAWAIGQQPPRAAASALTDQLRHADRTVRFYAAWTLGEIGDPAAVTLLQRALAAELDVLVQRAVLRALFESGDRSTSLIDAAMRSRDDDVRARGAQLAAGQKARVWKWPLPLPDPRPEP